MQQHMARQIVVDPDVSNYLAAMNWSNLFHYVSFKSVI